MTFTTINPVFTKKYVPKTSIFSKKFEFSDGVKAFYKGEFNDNDKRHGVGLVI